MRAFEAFTTTWIVSEELAVRCLEEKMERCLTFYDFPEAGWSKIRTNTWPSGLPVRPPATAPEIGVFTDERREHQAEGQRHSRSNWRLTSRPRSEPSRGGEHHSARPKPTPSSATSTRVTRPP